MRRNDIFFFSDSLTAILLCYAIFVCSSLSLFSSDTSYSDINALILDYLTMEGYPNAAAKFSKEANLQPQQDSASIRTRQEIQTFIHSGNIQSAIETLNELDPQVSRPLHKTHHFVIVIKRRVLHAPRGDPVIWPVKTNTTLYMIP